MSVPSIAGKRKAVTASAVLEALGEAISQIKAEDRLRWSDVGEVLGTGDDQAAKYADGSATMNVVAFAKGRAAWNGRFTGRLDKLIEQAVPGIDAHKAQSCILKAALALAVALEDGELDLAEVRANRSTLENARDAIDAQLARLAPKAA